LLMMLALALVTGVGEPKVVVARAKHLRGID
jgi:hypothetical protein